MPAQKGFRELRREFDWIVLNIVVPARTNKQINVTITKILGTIN